MAFSLVGGQSMLPPSSQFLPSLEPQLSTGFSCQTFYTAQFHLYMVRRVLRQISHHVHFLPSDHVVGSNSTHQDGVYCPKNETPQSFGIKLQPKFQIAPHYLFAEIESPASNSTTSGFDTIWGQFTTVPLFLILIVFPLINLKSATFFTRFNALGK